MKRQPQSASRLPLLASGLSGALAAGLVHPALSLAALFVLVAAVLPGKSARADHGRREPLLWDDGFDGLTSRTHAPRP